MASKNQLTGMTGVFLVAAELSKIGFIVSPTSRSALGADLLVTDQACKKTYVVQVKTNGSTFGFWLVGAKTSQITSRNLIYALVNLRKTGPEFFLIPSHLVARKTIHSPPSKTRKTSWYSISLVEVAKFKDNWSIFGDANPTPV